MSIVRGVFGHTRDLLYAVVFVSAFVGLVWLAALAFRSGTWLLPGHGHPAGSGEYQETCELCIDRELAGRP